MEEVKKYDKEYSTQWGLEQIYLTQCGIKYTFVKVDNGITTWKYKKTYQLFHCLESFYKNL